MPRVHNEGAGGHGGERVDLGAETRRFSREVDLMLAGRWDPHSCLMVLSRTPESLLRVGLADRPVLCSAGHLRRSMLPKDPRRPHQHGLSVELVKALPEALSSPCLVVESDRDRGRTVACLLDMLDHDGLPVVAAIRAEGSGPYRGRQLRSNFELSAYGRSRAGAWSERAAAEGRVLYADRPRLRRLLGEAGEPVPGWLG